LINAGFAWAPHAAMSARQNVEGVIQRGGLRDKMPSWLQQHVSGPDVGGAKDYLRPAEMPP